MHHFRFSQSMSGTGNCKRSLNEQSYLPDVKHIYLVNLGLALLSLGFTSILIATQTEQDDYMYPPRFYCNGGTIMLRKPKQIDSTPN